ncbi:vanadium-dependent haloperoxidase [Solihabitans fulvus]|uniref:vanadium-dependent haloperoxidase n=1 Tax=Solihabitans fulvus TaxID=1892852 RepID=UPI0016619C97|nr:vanadium-dependent haloperoxidase [Solihabitans fulvus]
MLVGAAFATVSPAVSEASPRYSGDSIVVKWNQQTENNILSVYETANSPFGPPTVDARALAITHTCMFDAWVAYDGRAVGTQLGDQLRRPWWERTQRNKETAISYAAYRALLDLFPAQTATTTAFMQSLGYDPNNTSTDTGTAAGIGNVACAAELNFRHQDGSNQLGTPAYADTVTGYQPVNPPQPVDSFDKSTVVDPSKWTPLIVNGKTQHFLNPQWGQTKPFAIGSADGYSVPAPPAYPSAAITSSINNVLDYSANLTDERKVIAEYWLNADVTPPGGQQAWARFVARRDHHSLDQDVKMFFALNMAEDDAAIVSWKVKLEYNYARPSTLIRYDKAGQQIQAYGGPGKGTVTMDGSNWKPYVSTPAFPATVSGHSTFSGAASEVLKDFTGSDTFGDSFVFKAGTSKIEPGITPASDVTLSWPTFSSAAEQAGISRLYGGMHWDFDNQPGITLGRQVGHDVWNRAQQYFHGCA